MDSIAMRKRLDRIPNLPTLPQVALKVNEMLNDPSTSMREMSDTIMKDQVIVSNILKLVNSAFYGFPSQIDNIHRAITVLGIETVRNAIMAVSVTKALSKANDAEDFSITTFWRHSIAVAITSRQLSQRIPIEVPETCFIAGLLHDIGKVIMARFLKEEFAQVLALMKQGSRFYDAEKSALHIDHAMIGGYLAKRWHLPDNLINAITYHHEPRENIAGHNLTAVIHAGDNIVNRSMEDSGTPLAINTTPENSEVVRRLIETTPVWFAEVRNEIESACAFFEIA